MYCYMITILMIIQSVCSRNAIQYFIQHKKVQNFSIEILKSLDNTTSNDWIEYKYYFDNEKNETMKNSRDVLRVGLFLNGSEKFDCKSDNEKFNGYSIDIIDNIKESLNISIEFAIIENTTDLQKLSTEIDMLVCHPHIDDRTLDKMNLTTLYPTIRSKLLLVYKPSRLSFTKDIFILTFAGSLWLVFFALLILLALCLRISTMKYATIPPNYESWTWVEITLWAIAAACQQGLSHTPSGFASCCIFFLGYLTAYLLYTGFAAAITSILVQHDVDSNLKLEKTATNKLQLIVLDSCKSHIGHFRYQFYKTEYVDDLDELFSRIDGPNRIGVAPEILVQQYIANNFNYEQASSYLTLALNKTYLKGFLIARNNSWKETLGEQILEMNESGILKNMLQRHLCPIQVPDLNSGYSSAGQEHVGSATLLFLGGVLASVVFLMAEFILFFYQKSRSHLGL